MQNYLLGRSFILFIFSFQLYAFPDWSKEAELPTLGHRKNIYLHGDNEFDDVVREGKLHALYYPVEVSGMLIPYSPFRQMYEGDINSPVKKKIFNLLKDFSEFETPEAIWSWLGLQDYPSAEGQTPTYFVPFKDGQKPEDPMGLTLMDINSVEVLSFSCAACHTGNLFGKKVLGMTNRFPRANELFYKSKKALSPIPSGLYKSLFTASAEELKQFEEVKKNLKAIGVKRPLQLGLDTSLAQVALSLARRSEDEYATKNSFYEKFPRYNKLQDISADSKPMVWWNLKYKTRWLSDGSIVSGNPILTNFLWNEIGRGVDLKKLETWIDENELKIKELTTAVFASTAPRFLDFFPANRLDLQKAKRGEIHFKQLCKRCHGEYVKNWSSADSNELDLKEYTATTEVKYRKQTRSIDVGTDPRRYEGMKYFAQELNNLAISKRNGIEVIPQEGYVPPPLVGIWARWPFLHNNSVPSLCALLSPSFERPQTYWAVRANDKDRDYDSDCVGYKKDEKGTDKELFFDTRKDGMRNIGHDEGIFIKNGENLLSTKKRSELIEFLKTL
jgi:hypothetical protein